MSGVVIFAGVAVVYALVASRLDRWSVTAPLVFVAAGGLLGPAGFDVFDAQPSSEAVRLVAELTLAVLLFADASTVNLRRVQGDARLPGRLLLIGLPVTIVAGAGAARLLFPTVGWAAAALLASILAPTDTALGLSVVTNRAVPARIRRVLNVESGLNDGIATPFVSFFLALNVAEGAGGHRWVRESLTEVVIAIGVAAVVGLAGGAIVARAKRRGWTTHTSEQLVVLALAFIAYQGSVDVGGNGFVAAFVAGLLFGAVTRGVLHEPTEFSETVGVFMSFAVWGIFGAAFAGPALRSGWETAPIVFALLSLTVVRMGPVALCLAGAGLRRDTVAFIGWFGPRGLASVVFTLLAIDALRVEGLPAQTLALAATWTILLSVVAHGLSAGPLANAYGRRLAAATPPPPELTTEPEPRVRRRSLGSPVSSPPSG